ncbi:MAG: YhcH/YjgK/YiaL family protein [Bacteroidaceae bacterium]|nr:YhcH/YjgK/YiaL family protein [Bacteroidaceae bacterium]MCF0187096.1 YhcH/YjgK/YiaL family protein [Bacteroidaceae bacterium]
MIICNVENLKRMENLHPLFPTLFEYVKSHDLLNTPLGRIEIQGDDLFINNSNPQCVTAEEQVLEMHRDYIDVHVLLEGTETIGWKALEEIEHISKAYDKQDDYELSDDRPTTFVTLHPGQCLIVFPEDPHAPIIGEGKIRKAIGKVRL